MAHKEWYPDPFLTRDPFEDYAESSGLMGTISEPPGARQLPPHMDMDIKESETSYEIRADLPGVTKDDIHVDLDNAVLRIHAERKEENKDGTETWHVQERHCGSVTRTVQVPQCALSSDISVRFENGVLSVHVNKSLSEAQGKKRKAVAIE